MHILFYDFGKKICAFNRYNFYGGFGLLILTSILLIYDLQLPLHPDEAYYWQWSRHLDLSYYDGPPMMAYLIRLFTILFGDNVFSIKLATIILTLTGCLFVYKLSAKLFCQKVARTALLILFFCPLTQASFLISTLDSSLFCFWSATLYFFYRALREHRKYCYIASGFLGLALLSKYNGVLVGVLLFIYVLFSKEYRQELRKIRWYLGALISFLIFSPVIWWNFKHDFAGFIYQYDHGVAKEKIFQLGLALTFIVGQIGALGPIYFYSTFSCIVRNSREICSNEKLLFLVIPFLVTFFFFFYHGLFKHSEANWPACAYISGSILLAYFIVKEQKKILLLSLVILNLIISILVRFPALTPFLPPKAILVGKVMGYPELMHQVSMYLEPNTVIISDKYQNASEAAFYLPGQPEIYILKDNREYQYWSADVLKKITQGKIKTALFIGNDDNISEVPFVYSKKLLKNLLYDGKYISRKLSLYRLEFKSHIS